MLVVAQKRTAGVHTVDSSITVLISLPNHLIDLVVRQLLADGCHDMTKFGSRNEAVVITIKDLLDT
jgi:hypothetical protein